MPDIDSVSVVSARTGQDSDSDVDWDLFEQVLEGTYFLEEEAVGDLPPTSATDPVSLGVLMSNDDGDNEAEDNQEDAGSAAANAEDARDHCDHLEAADSKRADRDFPDLAEIERSLDELESARGGSEQLLDAARQRLQAEPPSATAAASSAEAGTNPPAHRIVSSGSSNSELSAASGGADDSSDFGGLSVFTGSGSLGIAARLPSPPPGAPPQHLLMEPQHRRREQLRVSAREIASSGSGSSGLPPRGPSSSSSPQRHLAVAGSSPAPQQQQALRPSRSVDSLRTVSPRPPPGEPPVSAASPGLSRSMTVEHLAAAPIPAAQRSPGAPMAMSSPVAAPAALPRATSTSSVASTPTSQFRPINVNVNANGADVRREGHFTELVVVDEDAFMDPPLDPLTAFAVRFWIPILETKVVLSCLPGETFAEIKERIWARVELNLQRNRQAQPAYFTFRLLFGDIYFFDTDLVARLIDVAYVFREHDCSGAGNLAVEVVLERRIDVGKHLLHKFLPMDGQGELKIISKSGIRRWKPRFCVIQGHCLLTFENYKAYGAGKKPLSQVFLGPSAVVRPVEIKGTRKVTFAFELTYQLTQNVRDTIIFRAKTDAERNQWIFTVHRVQARAIKCLVISAAEELEARSLDIPGLFRVAGKKTEVIALSHQIDLGLEPQLGVVEDHELAGLMKLCIRSMAIPLLSFSLYPQWLQVHKMESHSERLAHVRTTLQSLSTFKQGLLQYLMLFLRRVSMYEQVNKMSPKNLAIVFAPNILRPQNETAESVAQDVELVLGAVCFLIEYSHELFPPEERHQFWLSGPMDAPLHSTQLGTISPVRRPSVSKSTGSTGSGSGVAPPPPLARPLSERELTSRLRMGSISVVGRQSVSGFSNPRTGGSGSGRAPDLSPGAKLVQAANIAASRIPRSPESSQPSSPYATLAMVSSPPRTPLRPAVFESPPGSPDMPVCGCAVFHAHWAKPDVCSNCGRLRHSTSVASTPANSPPPPPPGRPQRQQQQDEQEEQEEEEEEEILSSLPSEVKSDPPPAADGAVDDDDGDDDDDEVPIAVPSRPASVAPQQITTSLPPPPALVQPPPPPPARVRKSALPAGWVMLHTAAGVPYYHCAETGVTQWDRPEKQVKATTSEQLQLLEWLAERGFESEILGQSLLNNDIESVDTLMESIRGMTAKDLVSMLDLKLGAAAKLLRACTQYLEGPTPVGSAASQHPEDGYVEEAVTAAEQESPEAPAQDAVVETAADPGQEEEDPSVASAAALAKPVGRRPIRMVAATLPAAIRLNEPMPEDHRP